MWQEHGPDWIWKRGTWTLKVRKMRDGWSPIITTQDHIIWRDTRNHDLLTDALAACEAMAVTLADQLRGEV